MIKRMTKATSLLVAAAAMMSLVPASAATKLAVKEGTIENAIAFEGGNYVFYGYKTDDDDNGVYFNDGSKDKLLEDVEDYDNLIKYGTKYAIAQDGNDEEDQYMIDLSTGKVSDEDTAEDLRSTVETRLNSLLRKTERYENAKDKDKPVVKDSVKRISENQFGEVWYEYQATTSDSAKPVAGYTNQSGKYIDASVTANIYVQDTKANKMVKIEEFGDKEGNVTVTLADAAPLTIGEDSNYIYRIITVDVATEGETEVRKENYIQKISKAQGDKEDGAYLPKTVESYMISTTLDNKDVKKAGEFFVIDKNGAVTGIKANAEIRVVDGVIYIIEHDTTDEEVTVTKLVLKRNEKIEVEAGENTTKKLDFSVVKKAGDTDTDAKAYSIDVDGNVWAIYKGEISRSVKGGDFEVVYTCDRSLDRLDVYNEKSLVAWDEDGEVYTTVQEGKEASKDEAEDIVGGDTTVKTGWDKNADGTWVLYDAAGKKLTGWQLVNGTWYYMDKTTGIMQTGWLNDNGTWYYLQANGAMKTGWLNDRGTWYYLQANGAMKTGWLNDNGTWYYLQSNGAMKTGWFQDTDGRWYFLQSNGAMATNTVVDGYRLGANGAWIR